MIRQGINKIITLYHGSQEIIETPRFGLGKKNNDFGQGFYCTESEELAKEWATSAGRDGYANRYLVDAEYLRILNLNSPEYTVLNWIAVLIEHRLFTPSTPVESQARNYLIRNFSVNVNAYDIVTGYRADDSYYDFAAAFLSNTISIEQLASAMRLGKLGEQIVIKSKAAFASICYDGCINAPADIYFKNRETREKEASDSYLNMLSEESDGLYIRDIMRGKIGNDDPRIPRDICE